MIDDLKILAFPDKVTQEDGELDFKILQIVIYHSVELGPGPHGREVPYLKYGMAAIVTPEISIVSADGKPKMMPVPLPDGGSVKFSELKKRANMQWRAAMNQTPRE